MKKKNILILAIILSTNVFSQTEPVGSEGTDGNKYYYSCTKVGSEGTDNKVGSEGTDNKVGSEGTDYKVGSEGTDDKMLCTIVPIKK